MRFRSTFVLSLLLASAVLAVPFEHAKPQILPRSSDYSKSGAILTLHDNAIQNVQSTFIVPSLENQYSAGGMIWLGIDGATCANGGLRGGVSFAVDGDENPVYRAFAWYYLPGSKLITLNIDIAAGDRISVSIDADISGTSSKVTIENLTKKSGQYPQQFAIPPQLEPCMRDAQWIVQAPATDDNVIAAPLANFTEVTLEHPVATGLAGVIKPSDGALAVNIEDNNEFLTFTVIYDDSASVKYL